MSYRANDGSIHETRDAAEGRNASNESSDAIVGAGGKVLGLFAIILAVAPAVVAGIFSLIFSLLFRAGKVGRILQAAMVGIVGGIIITVSCYYIPKLTPYFDNNIVFAAFIIILPSALLAMWYYFSHYFTLKLFHENGKGIVSFFIFAFSIAFYGSVIAAIVGMSAKKETLGLIILAVSLIGTVVYYLVNIWSILSNKEEIKDIKEDEGLFPIGAIPALVLALIIPIMVLLLVSSSSTSRNEKYAEGTILEVTADSVSIRAAADLESETLLQVRKGETLTSTGTVTKVKGRKSKYTLVSVDYNGTNGWVISYLIEPNVAAIPAKNKKQKQIAAEYASGTVLLVNTNGKIKLYEEANELSKVVKEFRNKGGEKFISNGEVLFHPISDWLGFVPVDYNGAKGWITQREVDPIRGIATVVSDKAEFRPRQTYDANDKPINPQSITLKKGDTFEVFDVNEKYKSAYGIYNGQVGRVSSSDITVAKGQ